MTVFFTSDLHLYHRAVAYARRYGDWPQDKSLVTPEDVEWHNDMLAQRWDAVVRPEDVVWVLGDLTANNKAVGDALNWMDERPGTKHFVPGNHDPVHAMHSESHKWCEQYQMVFASVQLFAKRSIKMPDGSKQTVLLSHFPYVGDGDSKTTDRDTQYRLRNEGLAVLHGHVHSKEQLTYAPPPGCTDMDPSVAEHFTGRVQQIHVGLDAHDFRPVSLEQIVELLDRVG